MIDFISAPGHYELWMILKQNKIDASQIISIYPFNDRIMCWYRKG